MFDNTKDTVLLTGAGGFIGHHFVEHYLATTDWNLILLDSFRHKGMTSRLTDVLLSAGRVNVNEDIYRRVSIHSHDLNAPIDSVLTQRINKLSSGNLKAIINLASNSAVGRSLEDARECWENNCALIVNMLEFSKVVNNTMNGCFSPLFIQISTDEVYGPKTSDVGHAEWDTILPSNPYSASKAAQEALCMAYYKSFEMPIVIVNTMNNFGERQDPEKFIPRMVKMILDRQKVPIFTDENGVIGTRCYLHCKDHAEAIKQIINFNPYATVWPSILYRFNVCGSREYSNLEMAEMINVIIGNLLSDYDNPLRYELFKPKEVRPGYDKSYGLSSNKIKLLLGWKPPCDIDNKLRRVVEWTVANKEWLNV